MYVLHSHRSVNYNANLYIDEPTMKRKFLLPFAVSLAALMPVAGASTPAMAEKPDVVVASTAKGLGKSLQVENFVLKLSEYPEIDIDSPGHISHQSHSSHSSHSSHRSHYSSH